MKSNKMNMIFIIGNSRSGTTMMANILAKNNDILIFKELHFFDVLSTSDLVKYGKNQALKIYAKLLCSNKLEPWNINKYTQFLIQAEKELKITKSITNYELFKLFISNQLKKHGKNIAVEQTPRNSFHFEKIAAHMPNSRFIHMIRDCRAILISQKNKWKRNRFGGKLTRKEVIRQFVNYNPIITSTLYNKTLSRIISHQKGISDDLFTTVKYENLLLMPEKTLKNLFSFLNLYYSDNVLEINHSSSSFEKKSKIGIDSSRIGDWKNHINNTECFIAQKINLKLLRELNYKITKDVIPNPLVLIYSFIILPIQFIIILIFSFNYFIKDGK